VYCSKCGSSIADGSPYCPQCGQMLQPAAAAAPSAAPGPANVSPHWRPAPAVAYAGFWLRVVAYLIDSLIVGIPVSVAAVLLFFLAGGAAALQTMQSNSEPGPQFFVFLFTFVGGLVVLSIIGTWLYYAYFESSTWQGTVGKKILNLFVTDMNGNRVTFGRASGRFFAKIITGLIPLGIGYILAGITEKKQALHDMIANCLVLRRA
jgi:uncharacterized RDD family membrane protein YckC